MKPRLALPGLLLLAAACGRAPRLDTRTFELRHLTGNEAAEMVSPYVYVDRQGAEGRLSYSGNTFTVRETPDNLERIERVLAEYDRPRPTVRLHFQIIQANGAARTDPAIADVEAVLRRLFRFAGYRLVAQAVAGGREDSEFSQTLMGGETLYAIAGSIQQVRTSGDSGTVAVTVRLLQLHPTQELLSTSVNLRAGQTAVLGNAQISSRGGTLILSVKPELVAN
jgi:hypothetical protein